MLDDKKPKMQQRFNEVVQSPAPPPDNLPASAADAWREGFRRGKAQGYGDGLVDGTELGMDAALETLDVLLCQPVFTTGWAEA